MEYYSATKRNEASAPATVRTSRTSQRVKKTRRTGFHLVKHPEQANSQTECGRELQSTWL